MPYIAAKDRPRLDRLIDNLSETVAFEMAVHSETAQISERYFKIFKDISDFLILMEHDKHHRAVSRNQAEELALAVFESGNSFKLKGAWCGHLNYAITRLIQRLPLKLVETKSWDQPFRYWIYAQTVGALTRTAYRLDQDCENNWLGNVLCGVFEDIKDEYKRRVNTAYEAAQIDKSGDCYELSPYRTQPVRTSISDVQGIVEVMLPRQEPSAP